MDFSNNDFSLYAKEPIDNPILPYHRCYRPMKNRMNSGRFTCMYLLDDDNRSIALDNQKANKELFTNYQYADEIISILKEFEKMAMTWKDL